MGSDRPSSPLNALRVRDIRLLWMARTCSAFGSGATLGTLLLSLTEWTGSARAVAINGLLQAVPIIAVSWLAGSLVDRLDRRAVMIYSDYLRAAVVLVLVFANEGHIYIVFVVTAVQATVGAFFDPASSAFLPRVVPPERRAAVNGLFASSAMTANLAGLSLAGVLVATTDYRWTVFLFDAMTFAVASTLVALVRTSGKPDPGQVTREHHPIADMRDGLRLIRTSPHLLASITGSTIAICGFGIVNVTVAPMLLTVLQVSPSWFGPVNGSFLVAAITIGLFTGRIGRHLSPKGMVLLGLGMFALGIATMGMATHVVVLMLGQLICGLAQPVLATGGALIMQETVDTHRGRVAAAAFTSYKLSEVMGIAVVGGAASAVPLRYLLFGAACAVAAGLLSSWRVFRRAPPSSGSGGWPGRC